MERQGDIILFDEIDRDRCPALPPSAPIEAASDIFENIVRQQAVAGAQIQELNGCDVYDMNFAELLATKQAAHERATNLQAVLKDLGELAGAEIIAVDLPLKM